MKQCRSCLVNKLDTFFYRRASNCDGLYSYCIECTLRKNRNVTQEVRLRRRKKSNEYKLKNKTVLREKARSYYQKNKQTLLHKGSEYRIRNKHKISFREALKRLSDEERFEKNNAKHLLWSKVNRKRLNDYQREWYYKNKEKRRAHVVLNRAVKAGKIVRPNTCLECDKKCKPDGHHTDYSKPLDVIWICRACHARKSIRNVIR